VEPVREGAAVATVQVLQEDARPLAGRAPQTRTPLPSGRKLARQQVISPRGSASARLVPSARARASGASRERGEDPLPVGRERLGGTFPEPDRRRPVGSPQVGGGVAEILRRAGSATIREQERTSITGQGRRLSGVEPGRSRSPISPAAWTRSEACHWASVRRTPPSREMSLSVTAPGKRATRRRLPVRLTAQSDPHSANQTSSPFGDHASPRGSWLLESVVFRPVRSTSSTELRSGRSSTNATWSPPGETRGVQIPEEALS
jgi:hypothetical protein